MSPNSCTECSKLPPSHAESCPNCSDPASSRAHAYETDHCDLAHSAHKECKLIQLLGIIVISAGIFAALAESPIAATVSIAIGGAIYLTGLLASWWNQGD